MSHPLKSEGEQLDAVLDELQRETQIKEVSGWRSGFDNLDRALDGILPGLYLIVGASGCGKTAFAKQLLDQVVFNNSVAGIFFSFSESQQALRIRTLARMSGLDSREIRRGSAYLLHWYGVPRLGGDRANQLPASWEKLRLSAEEAKNWLDRVFLCECDRASDLGTIEQNIRQVRERQQNDRVFVVIDDCQRLRRADQPLAERLSQVAEDLAAVASELQLPIFAVAPLDASEIAPNFWVERLPSAAVILGLEENPSSMQNPTAPTHSLKLHIAKNRGGERGALGFEFTPAFAKFAETK